MMQELYNDAVTKIFIEEKKIIFNYLDLKTYIKREINGEWP